MYLEKIDTVQDLKKMSVEELKELSKELRMTLLKKLSVTGGHIGPNLGAIEMTIAIHYVFNSPIDKIVFDVSHQSATHKILTGRRPYFTNPDLFSTLSPYTNPAESKHDFFIVGHTSTSISLASGLAKSRDINGGTENIIAVIGDGSLSGGEAYEGLNNASEMNSNMIIIVNDNEMSVAENHGGIYKNLQHLRETNGQTDCNVFKALGFDYLYVEDGHNIPKMIEVFNKVKGINRPIIIHVHTIKGKGYYYAEKDKEKWHARYPFDISTGNLLTSNEQKSISELTGEYLLYKMKRDKRVIAITSGTPDVMGFAPEYRLEAGNQFWDVGIAEEHAVAMASGIAANGGKPVYGVFSSFIQRAYDQLSQDLCINNNSAVILVFGSGITGFSDKTHLGFFDIPLLSNIPNMVYLAPTTVDEYFAMLEWGINQNESPVAIRVPGILESKPHISNFEFGITDNINLYDMVERGNDIAILALGDFFKLGKEVKERLLREKSINATLINPRCITGLDSEMLNELKNHHRIVITLEDGVLDGGFGEKISRFYSDSQMRVKNYGLEKKFTDRLSMDEILHRNQLTSEQIAEDIINLLELL